MAFNLHTVTACLTRKQDIFWSNALPEGGSSFSSTVAGFSLVMGVQNESLLYQELNLVQLYHLEGLLDFDLYNNCVSSVL
jgi:hypothetical protein